MINPYTFYCIGFLTATLLYALGWSKAYPSITTSLAVFITITLIAHFVMARYWSKLKQVKFYKTNPTIDPILVTIFIYGLWVIDFIYEGGVPLIKILRSEPYNYRLFGAPGLHVLAVTFSSFYMLYLFHLHLSKKNKIFLSLYLLNLFATVLICSRSMFFFTVIGSFFIYLFSLEKIPYLKMALLLPLGLLMLYFFGVLGNKRVAFEYHKPYDASAFLETGKASERFRESFIPNEYFWSYIYISSPLANLQTNIIQNDVPPITFTRILECINNEYLFESVSKRVNKVFGIDRETEFVIKHPFNVSTGYSMSYSYLGWAGMIMMALFVLILPLAYCKLLSANNPYLLTSLAILCTMYLFFVYDNTIRLMALGFQLAYPIAFPFADRAFKRLSNG